jgi:hypothetical protein
MSIEQYEIIEQCEKETKEEIIKIKLGGENARGLNFDEIKDWSNWYC